jgi:hypothetical protein
MFERPANTTLHFLSFLWEINFRFTRFNKRDVLHDNVYCADREMTVIFFALCHILPSPQPTSPTIRHINISPYFLFH